MPGKRRDIRRPWALYVGAGGLLILGGFLLLNSLATLGFCQPTDPRECGYPLLDLILGPLLLFAGLVMLLLFGGAKSSYWGAIWRPDPIPKARGNGQVVDYPVFRWYWKRSDALDMIGVLSFLTGAFFFFTGLMLLIARQMLVETERPIPVHFDVIPPFIVMGVALLIAALVALLIPIVAPRSRS